MKTRRSDTLRANPSAQRSRRRERQSQTSPSSKASQSSGPTTRDIPELYELAPGVYLSRIPVLRSDEELSLAPLDVTAKRLLALVDGASSFARILEVSDLPVLDALPACRHLVKRGIVEVISST